MIEMGKQRLQVTVREDIVRWVDQEVKRLRFASRSHAVEYALLKLMTQGSISLTMDARKSSDLHDSEKKE